MKKLSLSKPLNSSEIEDMYYKIVRSQEFYNKDYAVEWKRDDTPQNMIAKMVIKHFKPAKVVDVGCGLGKVVKYLREAGVEAYGIDYSEAFFNMAPLEVRKYLSIGDISHIDFKDKSFDLVICMEVLEHLPLKLVDKAINELKRICKGSIFITIPSYGPNEYGPYGLPLYEKSWFEDARKNIPFSQIVVDEKGVPDCGHITLATYRWWSEKFLHHNLVRDGELELKINNDRELELRRWNWNIYVLNEVSGNDISANSKQFGAGWHYIEDWGQTLEKIRWTEKEAIVYLMPKGCEKNCKIDFYSGPKELIYDITVNIIVEQENCTPDCEIGKKEFSTHVNEWGTLEIPLSKISSQKYIRVKIMCDKKFNPYKVFNSPDNRELGIAIRRVYLE